MDDIRPQLEHAIGTVGKMVIGVSVFEWLYLARTFGGGRVHLLGNANVIAAMIALALPYLTGAWLFLAAAAMVATGSLAGLIGLGMWFVSTWKGNHKGLPLLVAGVALAVFIRPESAMLRLAFWQQAIRLFLAHPLAGVGPGLYRYGEWVHAHNNLATILAEMGTIGLSGLGLAGWKLRRLNWGNLAHLVALAPFFLIDDMTMWWAVMFGSFYVFVKGAA
jgi:O-antigen ligase